MHLNGEKGKGKFNENLALVIISNFFSPLISTCIENMKFREVTVDLLPGTSSGQ